MGKRNPPSVRSRPLRTGRSVMGEVYKTLQADLSWWQDRDLSEHEVLYLFLDGTYLKLRPEDKRCVAVLCAYSILWTGQKVLLRLAVGDKESRACWEAFLKKRTRKATSPPNSTFLVGDGPFGVRSAASD